MLSIEHTTAYRADFVLYGCAVAGLSAWLVLRAPAVVALGPWRGGALTLGVLIGYLGYPLTHHALHHQSAQSPWLQRRQRWHARHHHLMQPCCFGVTSGVWDRVFRTAGHPRPSAPVNIPVRRHNG